MNPRRETLDEAIDRIAASLTAVPADPAFAGRLRAQWAERQQPGTWRVAAACAAVALLAMAIALPWVPGPPAPRLSSATPRPAGRIASPESTKVAVDPPETPRLTAAKPSSPIVIAEASADARPSIEIVAALAHPESLTLSDIAPEDISLAAVRLEPLLEIASLDVPQIGASAEPEE
jgi:hypothetical protein